MKIRVYYEDTDVGGVVYHSNYLNFCERARSEAFFEKGMSPVMQNGHFVVKDIQASYIASAKLGEILYVKTALMELKRVSFKLRQEVYRDEEKLFEMDITLAFVDFEGKIKKLEPQNLEILNLLFT
ncbi:YbgC/FadM family acyl-CoA thioesterase [Sulfurimonas sp. HSL-1716]|uniref:YbgC/FadM family acyl-CoA thioesterase n=1 Tax=Hydrocurvibacter sulfurireducens TaxID=3131937 RepID=UPI0031F80B74